MQLNLKYVIIFLQFIYFINICKSQDCNIPNAFGTIDGNNISADVFLNGTLFGGNQEAGFRITNQPNPQVATIYVEGLWMGGYDNNGDLRVAIGEYVTDNKNDYTAGPILIENGQMTFDCENFDRLWEVYDYEIQQHIADFEDNGIVNNIIPNIFGYPGRNNLFFETFNGFSLPNTSFGLAPFYDQNNDGTYNPVAGDYPLPESVHPNAIPSHLIWGVFNDAGINHTQSNGMPLNVEIQQTVWSFRCFENEILNNTIFTTHKIINKSSSALDSMFIGSWSDMNIGCSSDDYLGCIPDMNTYYWYNEDEIDGTSGFQCSGDIPTFGDNPPVQAVTLLNQEMDNFVYYANNSFGSPSLPAPSNFPGFYTYLSGWTTSLGGQPFTYGGDGLEGSQLAKFVFPDHPNDISGWSMAQEELYLTLRRSLANIKVGTFNPNESFTITKGYTFYQDDNLDNYSTVDLVYDNTPLLQQMFDNNFESTCTFIVSNENILEESSIQVFPNPTSDILNIKMENPTPVNFSIFDIYGKKVFEKREINQHEIQLSTSTFSQGVYFLKIEIEEKELVKKFIKI